MRPVVPLFVSSVLLALVPGCAADSGCSTAPNEQTTTRSIELTSAEHDDAAGEDALLSAAECAQVCQGWASMREVEACDSEQVGADTGDMADTAGSTGPTYLVTCMGVQAQLCMGRPPAGLRPLAAPLRGLGAWAAHAASMEAASVRAFCELDASLGRLGAPETLRRSARRAARDEVRHAHLMASIARRHRAPLCSAAVVEVPPPDHAGLALENAVNGCVHETWSALLARHQALHAPDAEVRAAMATISVDEAAHAELGWAIHAWLHPASNREAVRAETQAALAGIRLALEAQDDESAVAVGLPCRTDALALFDRMVMSLWQPVPGEAPV